MAARYLSSFARSIRVAMSDPMRRLQFSVVFIVVLLVSGIVGYMLIERMSVVEALYMTVITITTVGFGEVKPLSATGRVFTIILILLGVGAVTSAVSNAVEIVLGQRVWMSVQKRRLEEWLMSAENHYVVGGYGRIGQQIVRDLRARGIPFVVIDLAPELDETFLEEQIPYVLGDATQDEVLLEAGIDRARGFVSALDTDADNVLAVLTARGLNPRLFIVARATTVVFEKKLRRAGADRVVSPYDIGGHRISLALLRPAVHDLLNHIFDVTNEDVELGEIYVGKQSSLAGQTLGLCDLRRARNVTILAIKKGDGAFTMNPNAQREISVGETVIVMGPPDAILQLENEHMSSTADAQ